MTRITLPVGRTRRRAQSAALTLTLGVATLAASVGLAPSAGALEETAPPTPGEGEADPSLPAEPTPSETTEDPADPTPSGDPAETSDAPAPPESSAADVPAEVPPAVGAPAEDGGIGVLAELPGDFGTGKLTVSVRPDGGSYPRDLTSEDPDAPDPSVDLGGAVIALRDITDPANPIDEGTCTTGGLEEGFPIFNGLCGDFFSRSFDIEMNRNYEATMLSAPPGFLVDPDSPVTFTTDNPECVTNGPGIPTAVPGVVRSNAVAEGCNNLIFEIPGAYRTVGVSKTSSVDGTPLAGATYTLCGTLPEPPPPVDQLNILVPPTPGPPANGACPEGSGPIEETTTGPDGVGLFTDNVYLPGDYTVFETAAPAGYVLDPNLQDFTVPEADDEGDVADPVLVSLTDAADVPPPLAVVDQITVPSGGSVLIRVRDNDLANDAGSPAPITLVSVTQPAHGTAEIIPDPDCPAGQTCTAVVRYTPAAGYSGVDSFSYTIATRGGSSTAAVNITVTAAPAAPPAASPAPPRLAVTGTEIGDYVAAGAGLVGLGALLLGGATLTRRREDALAR